MKDEDIKNIDNVLREKLDLGFLLDYLNARGKNYYKPFWLNGIDVLRFLPRFDEKVVRFRRKHGIEIKKIKSKLEQLLNKRIYNYHIIKSREFARCQYFPDLDVANKMSDLDKKILTWEKSNFPSISDDIGKLRILQMKGLGGIWQESIKNYVLYDRITLYPVKYRKQLPKIKMGFDNDIFEPYIEIKVYSNTNISYFNKLLGLKKIQEGLPGYYDTNKKSEETFLNRFLYFILKKRLGFSDKTTNEWLKLKGLSGIEQAKSSREIQRLLSIFIKK